LRTLAGSASIGASLVRPILTIGNFDGVHLGHRAILDTVIGRARARGGEAVVYTFEPHPRKVINPQAAPRLLTTLEQKLDLLAAAGVDAVIVEPFDLAFARTAPDVFIREYVHARVRPLEVYVGYDFHFGRDREGSMRMLTELGPRLGFSVTIIPEVVVGEGDVNSTRIRELLARGGVEEAAALLGREFSVRGRVVRGDARGRTLGFPTANLEPENEVLPAPGVYAGWLHCLDTGEPAEGRKLPVVTNVGTRPTFGASDRVVAEAHVIDFTGDLYERRVELSFRSHLRSERRFPGADALRAQIELDRAEARRRLAGG
jgi:riboflavin kinase/FMN adenylyltransferase